MNGDPLVKVYCRELHRHFGMLYAVWPVGASVEVGDFGVITKWGSFDRLGNVLREFGIEYEVAPEGMVEPLEYASGRTITTTQSADMEGSAPGAVAIKGSISIAFADAASVYFAVANGRYESIVDPIHLSRAVMERFDRRAWDKRHLVVTRRLVTDRATAIVSSQGDASVVIHGRGAAALSLTDARLQVERTERKNIGISTIAAENAIPLVGLGGVQRKFRLVGKAEFRTRSADVGGVPTDMVGSEPGSEDLYYFGDVIDYVDEDAVDQ